MRTSKYGISAALGTAALIVTFTLAGGGAASAAGHAPSKPASGTAASGTTSCWIDIDTGESLCVPAGVNLISAVEARTGYTIRIPAGSVVGGIRTTSAQASASTLSVKSTASVEALSELYDDINYGGGSYLMTGDDCGDGIANIGNFGWNDRASSFKSFSGCKTAIYKDINYDGTKLGYVSSKSSFGSMNDQASSWRTE